MHSPSCFQLPCVHTAGRGGRPTGRAPHASARLKLCAGTAHATAAAQFPLPSVLLCVLPFLTFLLDPAFLLVAAVIRECLSHFVLLQIFNVTVNVPQPPKGIVAAAWRQPTDDFRCDCHAVIC